MHEHGERSRLTPALLGTPAPHAARVIASGLLERVLAARDGLADAGADGLHDLRVAIRRLRSWLRAFRPELSDTVRGKSRRRLHALASATNEARDDEVVLAFIERQAGLSARARSAVHVVSVELRRECEEHRRETRRTVSRDLPKVARALESQLECWWERHRIEAPAQTPAMAAVFADALRQHARRLTSALGRIEPPGKAQDIHRARIAAKRLRYLLEPLDESFGAADPVRQLQALQRQLGDARDGHRIATRFVREIGEHAARSARGRALAALGVAEERDDPAREHAVSRAGLTELARRASAARATAFAEYATSWGDDALAAFVEEIDAIAARVAAG